MRSFREWAKFAGTLTAIAAGASAIIAFFADIEPWTPASRGWVRGWGAIRDTVIDKKIETAEEETKQQLTHADNATNSKLELLEFQNYDIQMTLLNTSLQLLKGEEAQLIKRLDIVKVDPLISARLIEA